MSLWGEWTCPHCGRYWEGGIGYFASEHPSGKEVWDRIAKICGCKSKMTEQDAKEAKIFFVVNTDNNSAASSSVEMKIKPVTWESIQEKVRSRLGG
jgi:hypothetical protein